MDNLDEAKTLHNCIILIAKEIHRICEKNSLHCFLIGGSLLGAIRHKGFIPWDDDLDFGLLRDDYTKFEKICETELNERFVMHHMSKTEYYGFSFIKIKLKQTHFAEDGNPADCFNGIFVDVFPIDKMPKSRIAQLIQKNKLKFLYGVLKYKSGNRSLSIVKNTIKKFVFSAFALQSRERLSQRIIKTQTMYNSQTKNDYYINLCGSYSYGREIFPKSSFDGDLKLVPFEEEEFYVPNQSHDVLSLLYGDYMKLPPIEKQRFKHSRDDIDFGPYKAIVE